MHYAECENAAGARASDPIEAAARRPTYDLLDGEQQLDEDEATDAASVKAEYLSGRAGRYTAVHDGTRRYTTVHDGTRRYMTVHDGT